MGDAQLRAPVAGSDVPTSIPFEAKRPRLWGWPADGRRLRLPKPLDSVVAGLDRALAPFWEKLWLFLPLVAVAIWASVWGFVSFYGPQYGRVPSYALPFVPDSPLSTASWVVAALAIKMGWDQGKWLGGPVTAFVAWTTVMNAKVGVWTGFAILFYFETFMAGDAWDQAFQWMLIGSHLGMVVFAVMLVRKQRRLPAAGYALVLGLVLLWDFMDYAFVPLFLNGADVRIYPAGIPDDAARLVVLAVVTVALSLAAWTYLVLGVRWRGPKMEPYAGARPAPRSSGHETR